MEQSARFHYGDLTTLKPVHIKRGQNNSYFTDLWSVVLVSRFKNLVHILCLSWPCLAQPKAFEHEVFAHGGLAYIQALDFDDLLDLSIPTRNIEFVRPYVVDRVDEIFELGPCYSCTVPFTP